MAVRPSGLKFTELSFHLEGGGCLIDVNSVLCVDTHYRQAFNCADISILKAHLDSVNDVYQGLGFIPTSFFQPTNSASFSPQNYYSLFIVYVA